MSGPHSTLRFAIFVAALSACGPATVQGDTIQLYRDADRDGYGDDLQTADFTTATDGWVSTPGDCDDDDATVFPGAEERCDGHDDDCDRAVDEDDAIDASTWYQDADGDGHGDPDHTVTACQVPAGAVALDDDCDDADASIHPDAIELCDGVDQDCDGVTDEDDAADASTWYQDTDGDGHGDPNLTVTACQVPAGAVAIGDDCDDSDASIHPDAIELCDGVDQDCDGVTPCDACDRIVPTDHDTIQVAIDAADNRDLICVDRGTYDENVDFHGHTVMVQGVFGPTDTIIDGGERGTVVTFSSAEGTQSELTGFTITRGMSADGGGIYISGASPTLVDLIITDNQCSALGGGLYIDSGSPTLESLIISDNAAQNGGGVCAKNSAVQIIGGAISDNTAENGGGIYVMSSASTASEYTSIEGTRLQANQAEYDGGGIYVGGPSVTLDNCIIDQNTATTYGGGLRSAHTGLYITHSVFSENEVTDGQGGGVFACCAGNSGEIDNTIFVENHASDVGGAVYLNAAPFALSNVALVSNRAQQGGGLAYYNQSDTTSPSTLSLVDISDNEATATGGGGGIYGYGSTAPPQLWGCNLWGNLNEAVAGDMTDPVGTNVNIAADPAYLDTSSSDPLYWDLHLGTSSALVDLNADMTPYDDADGSPVDIGVYGGPLGDTWDLDGDGAPAWYQPGPYDTHLYPSQGLDCDDQDASIGPTSGCRP